MSRPARPAHTLERVAVIVPIRDEEELIGSCLAHLRSAEFALARAHPHISVDLIPVLDSCTDRSAEAVRAAGLVPVRVAHGEVGLTRAAGAERAIRRAHALGIPLTGLWLASTDADTLVPTHWLTEQIALAATTDAVVGTVEPRGVMPAEVRAEWHRRHALREGHEYVHGANLAVRASLYRAIGGFRSMRRDEDVDLITRIRAHTSRWVATDRIRVVSSGRMEGRCDGGFATYLRDLADEVG